MDKNSIFPIINKLTVDGEIGITIIKEIIERDLNWIFRQNHLEDDFGIDAYIDITRCAVENTIKNAHFTEIQ